MQGPLPALISNGTISNQRESMVATAVARRLSQTERRKKPVTDSSEMQNPNTDKLRLGVIY